MIRVVFDTNVLVSAMLNASGTPANLLRFALHRHVRLCVSDAILDEYEAVLRRPKFRRSPQTVTAMMTSIRAVAARVTPARTLSVSADEADNRFLKCAEAAGADYIVTGNTQHFPDSFGRTRIINARRLVELVTPKLWVYPSFPTNIWLTT